MFTFGGGVVWPAWRQLDRRLCTTSTATSPRTRPISVRPGPASAWASGSGLRSVSQRSCLRGRVSGPPREQVSEAWTRPVSERLSQRSSVWSACNVEVRPPLDRQAVRVGERQRHARRASRGAGAPFAEEVVHDRDVKSCTGKSVRFEPPAQLSRRVQRAVIVAPPREDSSSGWFRTRCSATCSASGPDGSRPAAARRETSRRCASLSLMCSKTSKLRTRSNDGVRETASATPDTGCTGSSPNHLRDSRDQRRVDLDAARAKPRRSSSFSIPPVPVPISRTSAPGVKRARRFEEAQVRLGVAELLRRRRPGAAWSPQQQEERRGHRPDEGERQQAGQAAQTGELAEVPCGVRIAAAARGARRRRCCARTSE